MAEAGNGSPLTEWRNGLLGIDDALAAKLEEPTDPYAVLRDLGLPVPEYIGFETAVTFLDDSNSHLDKLGGHGIENFYVGLRTGVEGWSKYRTPAPIARDEVVPYITDNIPEERRDQYALRVAEYVVAVAGVVMIINRPVINADEGAAHIGQIHADIIAGDLGPMATGHGIADFQAKTDSRGILRYYDRHSSAPDAPLTGPVDEGSLVNTGMRQAIWRAIRCIPTDFADGSAGQRMPGYYEFAVVDHGGQLVPLFVDAKPSTHKNRVFDASDARQGPDALRLVEIANKR